MQNIPRIVLTMGEPSGIGPEIIIQCAKESWPAELVVIGDTKTLKKRAELLNVDLKLHPADLNKPPAIHAINEFSIIEVPLDEETIPGVLNKNNALKVLECIKIATELCLKQKASAMVTAPLHKAIINEAGISFSGHTEFLGELCGVKDVLMLFVTKECKAALVTTHIPLLQVSQSITPEKLTKTIKLFNAELKKLFNLSSPCILVAGLNPHAGENGHIGLEEIEIIIPTLEALRKDGLNVLGPYSADTLFNDSILKTGDAVLAMYHDQALPVIKRMSFGHAVNVTLGLPIIRTSVDHGTALDIAGKGCANPESLKAAIRLAIELASKK